ncbi:MAG TPA: CDP-archaeol synthase [Gammaproteobacteria bacterium]|nr:CDP-archaeol synthase [Gammaproteobacteria bacterium]
MDFTPIALLLVMLLAANGAPVLAWRLLGERCAAPVDGGRTAWDGRPLLGRSKTWRGLLASLLATPPVAMLLGLDWHTGLLVAVGAMAGDLLSSFLKRRLGIEPSGQALGLDQVPESLLPALLTAPVLHTGALDWLLVVVLFTVGELLLSRILYRLHLRKRPY